MIKIIKVEDVWKNVPSAWEEQYARYDNESRFHDITAKLKQLRPDELTGPRIEAIIGNNSWTRITCSECDEETDALIRIGDEPDYDARWVDLCEKCLTTALNTLHVPQTQ